MNFISPMKRLSLLAVFATTFWPTMALAGNPESVYLGALTDYLFVFLDGSGNAEWDHEYYEGGYSGDVVVNGDARFYNGHGVDYAGTIYSSKSNDLGSWEHIPRKSSNVHAHIEYKAEALFNILLEDYELAMKELCALTATNSTYENFDVTTEGNMCAYNRGAVPSKLNFKNDKAEVIVIDVDKDRMNLDEYLYIDGDEEDLVIFRWGIKKINNMCIYEDKVDFYNGAGIIPVGDLKPDRLIHVAGNIDSDRIYHRNVKEEGDNSDERKLWAMHHPTDYLPSYATDSDGNMVGDPWYEANFFVGYWLTTGRDASSYYQGYTDDLRDAVFIGGWYTNTTYFDLEKGGQHVVDRFKVDLSDVYDVALFCNVDLMNDCFAPGDDLRDIAIVGLQKAMVVTTAEENGPGTMETEGSYTTYVDDTERMLPSGPEDPAHDDHHRDLGSPNCRLDCARGGHCTLFNWCRRRDLAVSELEEELADDLSKISAKNERYHRILQHTKSDEYRERNRRRAAEIDSIDIQFPVIVEHHSFEGVLDHKGYKVSRAQEQCIKDVWCTLTYTMYKKDDKPNVDKKGNGNGV